MALEDGVQGMQDQAQKIIEMPQRDQQHLDQKIHHLPRLFLCMGRGRLRMRPAFLASISN